MNKWMRELDKRAANQAKYTLVSGTIATAILANKW